MYNLNDLKKIIAEKGVTYTIEYLSSGCLSEIEIQSLKENHILSKAGIPCLSLIYALV